jgi:hypothetical protein
MLKRGVEPFTRSVGRLLDLQDAKLAMNAKSSPAAADPMRAAVKLACHSRPAPSKIRPFGPYWMRMDAC